MVFGLPRVDRVMDTLKLTQLMIDLEVSNIFILKSALLVGTILDVLLLKQQVKFLNILLLII
jgi:hypothetical protein